MVLLIHILVIATLGSSVVHLPTAVVVVSVMLLVPVILILVA